MNANVRKTGPVDTAISTRTQKTVTAAAAACLGLLAIVIVAYCSFPTFGDVVETYWANRLSPWLISLGVFVIAGTCLATFATRTYPVTRILGLAGGLGLFLWFHLSISGKLTQEEFVRLYVHTALVGFGPCLLVSIALCWLSPGDWLPVALRIVLPAALFHLLHVFLLLHGVAAVGLAGLGGCLLAGYLASVLRQKLDRARQKDAQPEDSQSAE